MTPHYTIAYTPPASTHAAHVIPLTEVNAGEVASVGDGRLFIVGCDIMYMVVTAVNRGPEFTHLVCEEVVQ